LLNIFVNLMLNRILPTDRMPAYNKRFGASGGVTSNNFSWGIDRLWFCEPIVFPPPAPSRRPVICKRGDSAAVDNETEN